VIRRMQVTKLELDGTVAKFHLNTVDAEGKQDYHGFAVIPADPSELHAFNIGEILQVEVGFEPTTTRAQYDPTEQSAIDHATETLNAGGVL
jgi:hypothetical protein